jgi:hypothetical protein
MWVIYIFSDKKLKQDMIKDGYKLTKEHIEKYNLTNDLFNTESSTNQHHEDTDPTSEDPC